MTDMKVGRGAQNPRIYVYDKRLWDIRPERFCGELFRVFVGDETRKPRILAERTWWSTGGRAARRAGAGGIPPPVRERPDQVDPRHRRLLDPGAAPVHAEHRGGRASASARVQSICSREACDFKPTFSSLSPSASQHPDGAALRPYRLGDRPRTARASLRPRAGFKHMDRGDYQETLPIIQFDLSWR